MERLQDMVTTMRRKVDSHVLILHRERPAHTAMDWVPENGRRKRGGRRTHGEPHSMKTSEKWVSAGMEPAGSPVTVRYMEASRRPMLREEQEDLYNRLNRLRGRVVKAVGHPDHIRNYGVREVVSSIPDRGNIVG